MADVKKTAESPINDGNWRAFLALFALTGRICKTIQYNNARRNK